MNIEDVKNQIKNNLYRNIEIKVFGMRNKNSTYVGYISNVYPALFTVRINGVDKSFNYVDVLTGEVKIKYS